ncbi:MAG: YqaJ viral recombinase family protein, partial [Candidatus Contendobacter sp.]
MPVPPQSSPPDPTVDREAVLAQLAALPQAAHLPPEARRQWLDHQFERLRDEATAGTGRGGSLSLPRQIQRLSGFGASEIGVLVGERRGEYSPFATAREICAAKLLRALPAPPTGPMQRGLELEPHTRHLFLRQTGARPLPDLRQAVVAHRPRDHGWLLATPDDLVTLNGKMLVVDYKAPAEPPTAVSLEHACQLHQAALVAEDRGIRIEGLVLVALNLREWTVDTFLVERDPALDGEILAAGQHYWRDCVLQGELPPWPQRDAASRALALVDLPAAAKAALEQVALGYVRLDILAKQAR